MASLAKTLLAGTLLATASLCAGATSAQATYAGETWAQIQNRQRQNAPVNADATLRVVDPQHVANGANAQGNAYGTGGDGVSVVVSSDQTLDGDVTATSLTEVTGTAFTAGVHTTATGNAFSGVTYDGNFSGTVDQTVSQGRAVTADAHLDQGPTGALGDAVLTTTAVANSVGYGTTYGYSETDTSQSSGAAVFAETGADTQRITGTGAVVSTAVGNNLTSAVDMGSGTLVADQTQSGDYVYAGTYVATGWAQNVSGVAAASANNAVATSAYGPMAVELDQTNTSYVRSQSEVAAYEYGSAQSLASGVGNAVLASNLGQETRFDVTQSNSGGVDVYADYTGGYGYDSTVQATAHGNSVMGSACSTCVSNFEATSHQTNYDGVSAQANSTITGSARHATVNANAVGNSASYYVQRPTGH